MMDIATELGIHERDAKIERLRVENAKLRTALESIERTLTLPLTEFTDTDAERADAYRVQLEVHRLTAHRALTEGEFPRLQSAGRRGARKVADRALTDKE